MIEFSTLGGIRLSGEHPERLDALLAQPKRVALLAYLTLARPHGFQSRDVLLALFWPEQDTQHARWALNQAVHYLRRALGDHVVLRRGDDVAVDAAHFRCDAVALEAACERGRWQDALTLYTGELLPGLAPGGTAELDQWLDAERERLRRLAAGAASAQSEDLQAKGDLKGAIAFAREAVRLGQDDETRVRRLIELLTRAGDRAGAVRAYDEYTAWLRATRDLVAHALADQAVSFAVEGESRRVAGAAPRRPGRWKPIAAVAAALLVVGAGGVWIGSRLTAVEPRAATLAIDLAPGDDLSAGLPVDRDANSDRPTSDVLAFAPDGRTLVYAGWRNGHRSLFRRSIATGETTPIAGTDGAEEPFFSPDGTTVGFWANGWLERVPLGGGTPVQIAPVNQPGGASWGDDGRIVYADHGEGLLLRVSASGGSPDTLKAPEGAHLAWMEPGGNSVHLPWMLPGGKSVLCTVAYGLDFTKRRIEVLNLSTGAHTTVLENAADARYLPNGYLVFARIGKLMVAPFNPSSRRVTGAAVGVLSDVMQAIGGKNASAFTDAAQYTVSSSGDLAWLSGGITPTPRRALVIRNRNGPTVSIDAPRKAYLAGRFAPRGSGIAVSSWRSDSGGLWIVNQDRAGSLRKLISGSLAFFAWSPDATRIVAWDGDSLLEVVAVSGGSAPAAIPGGTNQIPAQWLPGDTILTVTPNRELGELPAAGGTVRIVLKEPGVIRYPEVSPDGRWLAYAFVQGNEEDVVLRAWPSLSGRRVVSIGTLPAWARGGRELLFEVAGGRVMGVDVAADGSTGQPHEVLSGLQAVGHPIRGWDVSADGERFLDAVDDSTQYPPTPVIHVTLGWFTLLAENHQ